MLPDPAGEKLLFLLKVAQRRHHSHRLFKRLQTQRPEKYLFMDFFFFTCCSLCILKAIGTLLTKASSYLPDFMNDHFLRIQSGKIPFAETVPNGHLYSLNLFYYSRGRPTSPV